MRFYKEMLAETFRHATFVCIESTFDRGNKLDRILPFHGYLVYFAFSTVNTINA